MKIAPAVAAAALLASHPASAQSVEEFYKSRAVTIMVGFNVGNIYDTVMRAVARHIGKHIPGNPTVIPVNRPGAGSLAAANQLFNVSPRDGTVIGIFNRSILTDPLLNAASAAKEIPMRVMDFRYFITPRHGETRALILLQMFGSNIA